MADDYGLSLRVGMLIMAEEIARLEKNTDRAARMRDALDKLWVGLVDDYPDQTTGLALPADAVRLLPVGGDREAALRFLIELAFCNPFAPYEHTVSPKARWAGLGRVAGEFQAVATALTEELAALREAYDSAQNSQKDKRGEALVAGALALSAIPIVSLLGPGLAGAAAITHFLALLGGGSLAAGGFGMTGGLWVLFGGSFVAGGTAAQLLKTLGPAGAIGEIMKLQVSFQTIRLGGTPPAYPEAFQDVQTLAERIEEFRSLLNTERNLNAKGAPRIKEMEAIMQAMERALKWMKKLVVGE